MVDPDLLPKLASDVAETLHTIEAHGFQPSVPQHFSHLQYILLTSRLLIYSVLYLGILLAVLLEDQFPLQPLILILSPPPVLSSLSFIFRHFVFLLFITCFKYLTITCYEVCFYKVLLCLSSGGYRRLGVTSNYLHTVNLGKLGVLSELNLLQHEGPHVVTEPVRVQLFSLKLLIIAEPNQNRRNNPNLP